MAKVSRLNWKCYRNRLLGLLLISTPMLGYTTEVVPEIGTGFKTKPAATGKQFMAVTANPYATDAAISILENGGSAVDAAIAAQLVLGLVEPQSSGIGGGGFLVHYDAVKQELLSFDGRETAPANVNTDHFTHKGKPLSFWDAVVGGHSVGTPGIVDMLENAHKAYGNLPWSQLFIPAINLAEKGFKVSPRLNKMLTKLAATPYGIKDSQLKNYLFTSSGQAVAVGTVIKNPAYAKTLEAIASQGAKAFYEGAIANNIVQAVNSARRAGKLSLDDLKSYKSLRKKALCKSIGEFSICGAPPASSGPITVMQQLAMLQQLPSANSLAFDSAGFYHRFVESSKLSFADRNRYIADPKFVDVPVKKLLDDEYLTQRSQEISLLKANKQKASAGKLAGVSFAKSDSFELPSTSHLSIVDQQGNIVSMTSSIETAFGSRIFVDGFLLNNQLSDFSFLAENAQGVVANRIEPNKRPRSSMAPMIVFKNEKPVLVIGSPGGSRIINYVAKTIYQNLFAGKPLSEAVASTHVTNLNGETVVESDRPNSQALFKALSALGHNVSLGDQTSGIHAISIDNSGLMTGVADPRREGAAKGQ